MNAAVAQYRQQARTHDETAITASWNLHNVESGFLGSAHLKKCLARCVRLADIERDHAVLDLGCGFAYPTLLMRRAAGPSADIVALDLDGNLLDRGRELFARCAGPEDTPPQFVQADAFDVAQMDQHLGSRRFDRIFALRLLVYLPRARQASVLASWTRFLRPNGRIVADVPHPQGVRAQLTLYSLRYAVPVGNLSPDERLSAETEAATYVLGNVDHEAPVRTRIQELTDAASGLEIARDPLPLNTWPDSVHTPDEDLYAGGQWRTVLVPALADSLLSRNRVPRHLIADFDGWVELVARHFIQNCDTWFRLHTGLGPASSATLHRDSDEVRMLMILKASSSSSSTASAVTKRDIDPTLTGKARKNAINRKRKEEKGKKPRDNETSVTATAGLEKSTGSFVIPTEALLF